jgi:hypothetical protein
MVSTEFSDRPTMLRSCRALSSLTVADLLSAVIVLVR